MNAAPEILIPAGAIAARPRDWPRRLAAFLAEHRARPFAWGENDCCLFAADWLLALDWPDPAAGLRDTYRTAIGANHVAQTRFPTLPPEDLFGAEQWPAAYGLAPIPPARASRGDIVSLVLAPDVLSLAVVADHRAAAPGPAGLGLVPRALWRHAWKV